MQTLLKFWDRGVYIYIYMLLSFRLINHNLLQWIHLLELFTPSPREGGAVARRRPGEKKVFHVFAAVPDVSFLDQNFRKVRLKKWAHQTNKAKVGHARANDQETRKHSVSRRHTRYMEIIRALRRSLGRPQHRQLKQSTPGPEKAFSTYDIGFCHYIIYQGIHGLAHSYIHIQLMGLFIGFARPCNLKKPCRTWEKLLRSR